MDLQENIRRILREETSFKETIKNMVKKFGFLKASKITMGLENLHNIIDLKGTQDDMEFVIKSILNNDIPDKICNFQVSNIFGALHILVNIPEPDGLSEWKIKSMEMVLEGKISSYIYRLGNGKVKGYYLNVSAVRC